MRTKSTALEGDISVLEEGQIMAAVRSIRQSKDFFGLQEGVLECHVERERATVAMAALMMLSPPLFEEAGDEAGRP
jgi:hypothetical protein